MVGLISTRASPFDIAQQAINDAAYMCTRTHGDAPEVCESDQTVHLLQPSDKYLTTHPFIHLLIHPLIHSRCVRSDSPLQYICYNPFLTPTTFL